MPRPRKRPTTTTLNVRGIHPSAAGEIKRAAQARGLTIGQYLHHLVLLHVAVRELADDEPRAVKILETLGLQTVKT